MMTWCSLVLPVMAAACLLSGSLHALPSHQDDLVDDSSSHSRVVRAVSNGVGVWEHIAGKNYFISLPKSKKSWQGAKDYCSSLNGALLISLDTPRKFQRMLDHFEDYNGHSHPIWTSGSDLGHNNRFKWMSTEEFFDDTKPLPWAEDEPDNDGGNEHCVMVLLRVRGRNEGKMFTRNCQNKYMFVCEQP